MVVAPEEDVAQPGWATSRGPSSAHVAPVPAVNEETGTAFLPHGEEGRGASFPCWHAFSGWQAETCHAAIPIPRVHQLFFPLLNKTHPLRRLPLHSAPLMGSLPPAVRGGPAEPSKGTSAF